MRAHVHISRTSLGRPLIVECMAILIDPAQWPGHDRMWSHVASDVGPEELHAFALQAGIPPRAFDRDHYDVPAEWYEDMIAAGARPVSSRELVRALLGAGLRRRRIPDRVLRAS